MILSSGATAAHRPQGDPIMSTPRLRPSDPRHAFYDVVWPHMAAVLRTAQYLTHDDAAAEDLTQETMLKAFRSLDTLADPQRVRPWLMTILRRLRIDAYRSDAAHDDDVSLASLAGDPPEHDHPHLADVDALGHNPDVALDEFSDQHLIRALKELPQPIRWALLLVDVEGFDLADAAAVLDVPTGTVKSRLHRGRSMIRTTLARSSFAMADR